jgi:hypothetical protein
MLCGCLPGAGTTGRKRYPSIAAAVFEALHRRHEATDAILPADLPLQPRSRYDLVLNLKTAEAMLDADMDRHMPIFIVILTTIRCYPSLAQNDLAKPSHN